MKISGVKSAHPIFIFLTKNLPGEPVSLIQGVPEVFFAPDGILSDYSQAASLCLNH